MSDPVEQERLLILEERANLKRVFEEDDARLRAAIVVRLSIRDRLMRRLEAETVKTVLQDDIGDFEIETRLMTTGEIQRALMLDKMFSSGDADKFMEAVKGYSELLDEICVTPSLSGGFWTASDCPAEPAVKVAIVMNTALRSADIGRRVSSFRRQP